MVFAGIEYHNLNFNACFIPFQEVIHSKEAFKLVSNNGNNIKHNPRTDS